MTVHRGLVKLCKAVAPDSDISNQAAETVHVRFVNSYMAFP